MVNAYIDSVFKVFNKFDTHSPKTFKQIIDEFGDDIYGLTLCGDSLYKFVKRLKRDGSISEDERGYILTDEGIRDREEIRGWIEQEVAPNNGLPYQP